MKYMGSKSRIAKNIVPIIQHYIDSGHTSTYIEPFVGGANIIDKIQCKERIGGDLNKYLIALYHKLQFEPSCIPASVSREEYSAVRGGMSNFPDWYVGAVGFLASYNGRFFDGGYSGVVDTKIGTRRDYFDEAKRNLERQMPLLSGVVFLEQDYREFDPFDSVIYCDPPYLGTKKYQNSREFDYPEFWEVVRYWSNHNVVIVSEKSSPPDFNCIWQKKVGRSIKFDSNIEECEKLFVYEEGKKDGLIKY